MRIVCSLLLISCAALAAAQSPYEYFNGETFWRRLVIDHEDKPPVLRDNDTMLIVATTRVRREDGLRFMGEERDGGRLRYFFVYAAGGKWHLRATSGLGEALRYLPDTRKDWVIYTEGMGKVFTSDLDRGMQMAAQYDVHVLLFDYPSIRTTYRPFHNYRFAVHSSRAAYRDFLPLMDSLKRLRRAEALGDGHLSLFFHSMGNNVLREIAKRHKQYLPDDGVWVDNLIMNAPCVPRRRHKQWVDRIRFSRRTYIHYNPEDGTLKWARIAGFRQVLGEHAKKPLSTRAVYVNFNRVCGNGHSNFLQLYGHNIVAPEARAHYRSLLHGDTVQLHDRRRYLPSSYRKVGWDLLPASAL